MPLTININGDFSVFIELESLLRLRANHATEEEENCTLSVEQNEMKSIHTRLSNPNDDNQILFFFPFSVPFLSH